jgi:hypothetical protein
VFSYDEHATVCHKEEFSSAGSPKKRKGLSGMNCYLCLVETGCRNQPAYVLCRKCLAGICQEHLVEIGRTPATGLAVYPAEPHFMCLRCYNRSHNLTCASSSQGCQERQGQRPTISWHGFWQQFWWWCCPQRQPVLPTPQEALETVEHYLRQQRD